MRSAVSFVLTDLAFSEAFVDPPLTDAESVALVARSAACRSHLPDMLERRTHRLDRESDFVEFESKHDADTFRDGEPEREIYIRAHDGRYRAYDLTDLKRSARYAQEEQLRQEHSPGTESGREDLEKPPICDVTQAARSDTFEVTLATRRRPFRTRIDSAVRQRFQLVLDHRGTATTRRTSRRSDRRGRTTDRSSTWEILDAVADFYRRIRPCAGSPGYRT